LLIVAVNVTVSPSLTGFKGALHAADVIAQAIGAVVGVGAEVGTPLVGVADAITIGVGVGVRVGVGVAGYETDVDAGGKTFDKVINELVPKVINLIETCKERSHEK